MLSALSRDLLLYLIESTPGSALTYALIISLDHQFRSLLRGEAVQLSFNSDCEDETPETVRAPPADALAALLGPCRNLKFLELNSTRAVVGCGRAATHFGSWIDAAFAKHDRLHTFRLPTTNGLHEEAVLRILGHLPPDLTILSLPVAAQITEGSTVLSLIGQRFHNLTELSMGLPFPGSLDSLAPACAHLSLLQLGTMRPIDPLLVGATALARLHVQGHGYQASFASIPETLRELIVQQTLSGSQLAGPAARCRNLVTVSLALAGETSALQGPIQALIQGNPGLEEVRLRLQSDSYAPLLSIFGMLTRLRVLRLHELIVGTAGPTCDPAEVASLASRLESLALSTNRTAPLIPCPGGLTLRSGSLRNLDLNCTFADPLVVEAPALQTLSVYSPGLVPTVLTILAPALQTLSLDSVTCPLTVRAGPLTHLESLHTRREPGDESPPSTWADRLWEICPRLCRLDGFPVPSTTDLGEFCRRGAHLTDVRNLWCHLPSRQSSLLLPAGIRRFALEVELPPNDTAEFRLEGENVEWLRLTGPIARTTLVCPRLRTLMSQPYSYVESPQVEIVGPTPPLRYLAMESCPSPKLLLPLANSLRYLEMALPRDGGGDGEALTKILTGLTSLRIMVLTPQSGDPVAVHCPSGLLSLTVHNCRNVTVVGGALLEYLEANITDREKYLCKAAPI
ncbi:hypothetical protein PAPYR_6336 [Paratrimastix pyriformis]|uniref:Uncharacterized protein n=1 Tax=Paratrimastix pyriformis TaxID=342808 RepID=A0ABQ8UFM3_9EUKA|nr:hypothetical protein PAPYR_6336 [Paratrimastix pyriformis]